MGATRAVVTTGLAETVRDLLTRHSTLFEAAARSPDRRAVAGRGTAYVLRTEAGAWLVRHYRRGGAVAGLLGDRYARVGAPRAFRELATSAAARAHGVPTPEVVAAVAYAAGLFTRGDIAVRYIEHAADLAEALFGDTLSDPREAAAAAAQAIRAACERGLFHADLNLKNVLIAPDRAWLVDLDRCRFVGPGRVDRGAMQRRFFRSLDKWQARTGTIVDAPVRRTLEDGFRAGHA